MSSRSLTDRSGVIKTLSVGLMVGEQKICPGTKKRSSNILKQEDDVPRLIVRTDRCYWRMRVTISSESVVGSEQLKYRAPEDGELYAFANDLITTLWQQSW